MFASQKEADAERDAILNIYMKMLEEYLALPGIPGRKTESEKFAGAVASYSIEHIMPDGWAIQGPDFHSDGQNFSKAFEIKFLAENGGVEYAWQNTYAISTRELGVMVATHGDDKGLILPPMVAYIQIIIVPIYRNENKERVIEYATGISKRISSRYRARIDSREGYSPGYKFSDWEMKGIPLRIELGENEMRGGKATLARRDNGEKTVVGLEELDGKCGALLSEIQRALYRKAAELLKSSVHEVEDYGRFKEILEGRKGMLHSPWCGRAECEAKVKEETGAKITNMPFQKARQGEKCIYCGEKAEHMANFARSY